MKWFLILALLLAVPAVTLADQSCVGGVCRVTRKPSASRPETPAPRVLATQPRRAIVRGTRQR
jgi:hypothetical protein